jgi:hypothetical protein
MGERLMIQEVIVMYNEGKLRMVYAHEADALCDKQRLVAQGYKNIRLQQVQVQYKDRVEEPLSIDEIEALKRCVERS